MSENSQKQSVRQLPAGKLGDLKKFFEDGRNSEPQQPERQMPPPRPPHPPARVKSPERPRLPPTKPPHGVNKISGLTSASNETNKAALYTQPKKEATKTALQPQDAKVTQQSNQDLSMEGRQPIPVPRERRMLSPTVTRRIMSLTESSPALSGDNSAKKPQTPKKPPVQKKPSNTGVVDNPVYSEWPKKEDDPMAESYSKVNRDIRNVTEQPAKVTRNENEGVIQRREAVRKPPSEWRTTVASYEPEESSNQSGVNVATRTKLFDSPKGPKPIPPKKSEVVRSMSMRTSKEVDNDVHRVSGDSANGVENEYAPPWDTTKNTAVEKLKKLQKESKSASTPPPNVNNLSPPSSGKTALLPNKPPPLPSQPPPKPGTRRRTPSESISSSSDSTQSNVKIPLPVNRDSGVGGNLNKSGPPPKPPRTHAHDKYILTKISGEEQEIVQVPPKSQTVYSDKQNNTIERHDDAEEEVEYFSVKDRIAQMTQSQQSQGQKAQMQSSLQSNTQSKNQENVIRQKPPSRPPPPKPRPNSGGGDSNSSISSSVDHSSQCKSSCHGFKPSQGGPTIIPVYPRGQPHLIQRQKSATYSRKWRDPRDELPDKPQQDEMCPIDTLQRFPLRKSYSSECLHSSRASSLNSSLSGWGDYAGGPQGMDDVMSRSSYAYDYEAVIDPDGYAVPHTFIKLPAQRQESTPERTAIKASPGQFLTRLKGFEGTTTAGKTSPTKDDTKFTKQDLSKVNKKKMIMVREKINQAYAALDVMMTNQADDTHSEDNASDQSFSSRIDTEEVTVDAKELKKRIKHCTTVRLKSSQSVKRSKEYLTAIYPQLFEYCLVVGLRPVTESSGYEPYLIHKFPENDLPHQDLVFLTSSLQPLSFGTEVPSNLSIPSFCFPDASIFKPGSTTSLSESYSFVMTHADGTRMYGYCRRVQPPDSSLPEVICIISPIDAFNMYNTLLGEIETRRHVSSDLALELIAASFGRPLPKPGKVCHIRTLDNQGEMETIFLSRPTDNRLDDVNYESPLFYLGTERLVKVFSSMLMERRIILCSSNLSILTQTVHALCALLYPFQWQHVFVPLLPLEMLDVVCAPMPYIVGVLSAFLPQVLKMETEEVFIIDLDKKSVIKCQGDESTILPRKVYRALKTAINMCKIDSEAQNAQWLMVAEAFLRMFIETIGHFPNHVRTQQDGNRIFQKEGFILEMVSKELRQFLEWFTETQMFEVFIVNLVDKSDCWTSDLFMQRLKDHKESKEETNRRKGIGAKVKNFGKALKTKLQAT